MTISEKQTLKLDPDNRSEHQIEIDRARIEGQHEAIKLFIAKIKYIEDVINARGDKISEEFIMLKNELGVMVYREWPYDNQ